ncbi:HP1 family phage holin [Marinibactrum halimedae]|uniref:Holin n=1 Tax=Marinibactrum halimedae TaxID=1444977 RepID=A0AA37T721_9GAMM|nr:HP1 family phage holin [Marinibactrum halimedae]MCD9458461.1 phage holin family protein [Marinibactrum halimedae]GLS26158.1 hypothetical protein GCM10007877_18730 [Marinibactrum halimedae]
MEKVNTITHWSVITVGFFNGLSVNQWFAVLSLVIGLFTLGVNWFYRHKEYTLKLRDEQRKLKTQLENQK